MRIIIVTLFYRIAFLTFHRLAAAVMQPCLVADGAGSGDLEFMVRCRKLQNITLLYLTLLLLLEPGLRLAAPGLLDIAAVYHRPGLKLTKY